MKNGRVVKDDKNIQGFHGKHTEHVPSKIAINYKDVLLIGLQKDEESIQLYVDLAGTTSDAHTKEVLLALAKEEAGHKQRFQKALDFLTHIA